MNVLVRNEYRVEVILSISELEGYGITYEEIDYRNIETRRMLWALQGEIREKYGYSIKLSGRLLIEVIKDTENSVKICFFYLSPKTKDDLSLKQLIKSECCPVIAEFSDFEEMLQAVSFLGSSLNSRLFEKNGKYRILFSVKEEEKEELILCLCEFAEIFENSPKQTAECCELWNMIADTEAVSRLQSLF